MNFAAAAAMDVFACDANKVNARMQVGEKGHAEFAWSVQQTKENVAQIFFQLTRKQYRGLCDVDAQIDAILQNLMGKVRAFQALPAENRTAAAETEYVSAKGLLVMLFKMLAQTRDVEQGKGECDLAYGFLLAWYRAFPEGGLYMMEKFLRSDSKDVHPFGSWKDAKYMATFVLSTCSEGMAAISSDDVFKIIIRAGGVPQCMEDQFRHPLVERLCDVVLDQLRRDELEMDEATSSPSLSLVAKWIPREGCNKFGWFGSKLACRYYKHLFAYAQTLVSKKKAYVKCRTLFRKLLAKLNRALDTVQIKQCGKRWAEIDLEKVTAKTMLKQRNALMNKGKHRSEEADRVTCAEKFVEFIAGKKQSGETVKGSKLLMNEFTRAAFSMDGFDQVAIDTLNLQWKDSCKATGPLGKMVAMVDVSGSMAGEPMEAAIALGIRVAEKSVLGNRVLTFDSQPCWVNLDGHDGFVAKVKHLQRAPWGGSTNFHAALDLILNAIVAARLPAAEVSGMVLAIFSDMQIDQGDRSWSGSMFEQITAKYRAAGIQVCGVPYEPPHILFWNLRSTSGFPCQSSALNASMFSGFSASLLNAFCEDGLEVLQSKTAWDNLVTVLDKPRYEEVGSWLQAQL